MYLNVKSNGVGKSFAGIMIIASLILSGCRNSKIDELCPWDGELCVAMESFTVCSEYSSIDEYFERSMAIYELARQLNEICHKRRISRCAVAAAAHIQPFAYNERSVSYVYVKHGCYVSGIEFQFNGHNFVQGVVPFDAIL